MTRFLFGFPFLHLLLAMPVVLNGQSFSEHEAKAALLHKLASYVEWPEDALSDADSLFTIGVMGSDPIERYVDDLESETVLGRRVRIRRFSDPLRLEPTHILFVGASERERLTQVLSVVADRPVLTVGEAADFTERGGIIRWFIRNGRIRLEVNRCAAERSGLRLSSFMLRLSELTAEQCSGGGR